MQYPVLERMKGSEAAAAQLVAEGVDTVFTIPGLHNVHLCDALLDHSGLQILTGRHEQGLALMANGYTRACDKIAVPLVISGPGVINALTALADAYLDSVPMVLIAAASDTGRLGTGALHELKDQTGLLASICKWNTYVQHAGEIPEAIRTAFEQARSGRPGPAAVEIPMDIQTQEATVEIVPSRRPEPRGAPQKDVADAVGRLTAARSPVMYVGDGAGAADAGPEIVRLADRLGIPCFTTALAKGIVPENHPLSLGNGLRREPIRAFLDEADLALVVGSSLDEVDTGLWQLELPENLIQIDVAPEMIGRNFPVAVGLLGDVKSVLQQVLVELETKNPERGASPAGRIASLKAAEAESLRDHPGWQYMRAIQDVLDEDAIVTNDAATANAWALHWLQRTRPRTMNISSGLATLGFALPSAVGAKAAHPDRQVLALVGDGGFLFSDYALSTAVQHRLGVVTIVFNDNCYSTIKRQQLALFGRAVASDLHNPDFPRLAEAYGATGAVARTPDQLRDALLTAWRQELPTLIEVPL
ncbi:thiamine pyrophosphate-binding protein [Actinomycetota bacterium]